MTTVVRCRTSVFLILCSVYFFFNALRDSGNGFWGGLIIFRRFGFFSGSESSSEVLFVAFGMVTLLKTSNSGGHKLVPVKLIYFVYI